MNTINRRQFQYSIFATYISSIIQAGFILVINYLLIKYLSTEEYGSYHIILSINTFTVYLTSFGLASVFSRYIPEFIQKNNSKGLIKLTVGGVVIRFVGVIFVLFLFYLLKHNIFQYFSFSPFLINNYIGVLCFVFFLKIDETLGPTILAPYLEHGKLAIVLALQSFVRMLIIIASLYCFHSGLEGMLYGFICMEIFISIIYFFLAVVVTSKNIKQIQHSDNSLFPYARICRYGGYTFLLASTGLFRDVMVDNFVITHYLGVDSVAYYGFCYTIINMITHFSPVQMLKMQISHWVVREYVANRNFNTFTWCYRITTTISFAFLVPLLSFTAVFTDEIILLLNNNYADGRLLIICMFLMVIGNAFQFSYSFAIDALEKVQYRFYANIFSIYNLIADIVLIQFFGIYGVIFATGSASILTAIYYHYVTKKIGIQISYNYVGFIKVISNVVITLLVVILIHLLFIKSIIILCLLFAIMYLFLLLFINPFSKDEWEMFKNLTGIKLCIAK